MDQVLSNNSREMISFSSQKYMAMPIENKSHVIFNRICVKKLPIGTRIIDLKNEFVKYGKVIDCNLITTYRKYWYGFVTFCPVISAGVAIKLVEEFNFGKRFYIGGKKLNISKAWFKPKGRVGDDDDDDDGGIPLSSRRRASLQSIQSSSSSGSSVQNRLVPLIPGYVFNQPCPVYLPPFNIVYFY